MAEKEDFSMEIAEKIAAATDWLDGYPQRGIELIDIAAADDFRDPDATADLVQQLDAKIVQQADEIATLKGAMGMLDLRRIHEAEATLAAEASLFNFARKLPQLAAVELALRALNGGGLEFRQDCCRCDPPVGHPTCEYCAIMGVLQQLHRMLKPAEAPPQEA